MTNLIFIVIVYCAALLFIHPVSTAEVKCEVKGHANCSIDSQQLLKVQYEYFDKVDTCIIISKVEVHKKSSIHRKYDVKRYHFIWNASMTIDKMLYECNFGYIPPGFYKLQIEPGTCDDYYGGYTTYESNIFYVPASNKSLQVKSLPNPMDWIMVHTWQELFYRNLTKLLVAFPQSGPMFAFQQFIFELWRNETIDNKTRITRVAREVVHNDLSKRNTEAVFNVKSGGWYQVQVTPTDGICTGRGKCRMQYTHFNQIKARTDTKTAVHGSDTPRSMKKSSNRVMPVVLVTSLFGVIISVVLIVVIKRGYDRRARSERSSTDSIEMAERMNHENQVTDANERNTEVLLIHHEVHDNVAVALQEAVEAEGFDCMSTIDPPLRAGIATSSQYLKEKITSRNLDNRKLKIIVLPAPYNCKIEFKDSFKRIGYNEAMHILFEEEVELNIKNMDVAIVNINDERVNTSVKHCTRFSMTRPHEIYNFLYDIDPTPQDTLYCPWVNQNSKKEVIRALHSAIEDAKTTMDTYKQAELTECQETGPCNQPLSD